MHNNKLRKGFTLIELLIVIAIIGVLAGAVVVSLGDETAKANNATTKLNTRSVATQALVEAANAEYTAIDTLCTAVKAKNAQVIQITPSATLDIDASGNLEAVGDIGCVSYKEQWAIIGRGEGTDAFGTGNSYWCVDHKGHNDGISDVSATAITATATACT